ncbi:MAG: PDZ domain-containing protein [Thermodesulfobacteriota bacterium]
MSIRGLKSGINVSLYINLLLLLAALFVAVLLAREYASTKVPGGGGIGSLSGAYKQGKVKSSFTDYTIIGMSGVLGARTVLTPIHKRTVKKAGSVAAAAAVNSDAVLLGTVTGAGGGDKGSMAIFRNKATGGEEVIARGESVFGIGRLVSVSQYRAVVESGGRLLTFTMDLSDKEREMFKTKSGSGGRGAFVPGSGGIGSRRGLGVFGPQGPNPFTGKTSKALAKPVGKGKWLIDKRALENSLKDSNSFISDARFYPYREGGVVKGFMLSQVRPSGVFYGLGIRSGDIILRVNDYTIDAPEKAMSLMKGLKGETDVKVDLLRRGHAQTYKYEIR